MTAAICTNMSACSSGISEATRQKVLDEKLELESKVSSLQKEISSLGSQLKDAEEKLLATPTPTPEPTPPPVPTPIPEPTPKVTAGQSNALRTAKSYLNYTAFSYEGLIDQLEYEGFTHEQAVYGVDGTGL